MQTIHDVAERAGVSSTTVSRYMNNSGYVGKKARERIAKAIAELNYVPNSLARSLHSKATHTIGLLLPDILNVHWTSVARGIEDEARKEGFVVILCNTDSDKSKLDEYISILMQKQVDGLIYVPFSGHNAFSADIPGQVQLQSVHAIILDSPLPDAKLDTVLVDSRDAAFKLTELMLSMGHRRIAMITGEKGYYTSDERLAGYLKALKKAKIKPDKTLIEYTTYDMPFGHDAVQKLLHLPDPPTAIFAANNMVALGAIQAIREAGLRIPEDISLACFDDIPQASIIDPFLTVASQPAYEIGQIGARMLLERIKCEAPEEPRTVVLPAKIIQRRSCAPVKQI